MGRFANPTRWALSSIGVAGAARILCGPLPLNYYDIGYALIWGREITRGHLPDFRTQAASTPHPLATAYAALAAAFGAHGSWLAVQIVLFLAFGIVCVSLFALVAALFHSRLAAVLAAGALGLSPPFLTDALGGSGLADLPALALVLAAAALEARRPRRGLAPLVLLALAGLLRPEAWGLAGLYWLWLVAMGGSSTKRLLGLASLVVAAPALWLLGDAAIAGDATYSLTHTQAASKRGTFATGLTHAPGEAARDLRALLGLPVLLVGLLGAGAALVRVRTRRSAALPLILLGAALAEFALLGLLRVPLLERFLLLAAAMLAAFFGYALVCLRAVVPGRSLRAGAAALAALLIAFVLLSDATRLRHIRRDQRASTRAQADLVSFGASAPVRSAVASCAPALYAPRFTLISLMSYDFDVSPKLISRTQAQAPARGLVLAPATAAAGHFFGADGERLRVLRASSLRGLHPVAADRSWRLYARGCAGQPG
ncbi:MAG: hypothetical protein ACR2ND_10155 [Solirubrobacteraceae bacterium]